MEMKKMTGVLDHLGFAWASFFCFIINEEYLISLSLKNVQTTTCRVLFFFFRVLPCSTLLNMKFFIFLFLVPSYKKFLANPSFLLQVYFALVYNSHEQHLYIFDYWTLVFSHWLSVHKRWWHELELARDFKHVVFSADTRIMCFSWYTSLMTPLPLNSLLTDQKFISILRVCVFSRHLGIVFAQNTTLLMTLCNCRLFLWHYLELQTIPRENCWAFLHIDSQRFSSMSYTVVTISPPRYLKWVTYSYAD